MSELMAAKKSSTSSAPVADTAPSPRKRSPTRAQKQAATRTKLLHAAAEQIGLHGYSGASIHKIAAAADIASGTFYNYFSSQQDLFDQLLPELGNELLDVIREAIRDEADGLVREELGFRAFFEYIGRNPAFHRILNEAEIFAPEAYRLHIDNMVSGYLRALRSSRVRGEIGDFSDRELEIIVYILLSARNYISYRFFENGMIGRIPDWAVSAYMKFLASGISKAGHDLRIAASPADHDKAPPIYRVEAASPGYAQLSMTVSDGHLDESGTIDRAALTGLIDRASGQAINDGARSGAQLVNLSTSFLRPSHARTLIATARVSDDTGAMVQGSAEIHEDSADGVLVATASFLFTIDKSRAGA